MCKTSIPCLLPQPKFISFADGVFEIDDSTAIVLGLGTSSSDLLTAQRLKEGLKRATGYDAPILRSDRIFAGHDFVLGIMPDQKNSESYRLGIDSDRVTVDGASSAGLRYGIETLLQIIAQHGIDLPALAIDDAPDFAIRGLYHDVTRGQVPTLDTMKQIADMCAAYKINHLELYIEHSFLFRSMPEIGAGLGAITGEEILELDRYCKERYIDLVPSISTFGHMYEVIRTRCFHHLNELDMDAGELPYNWRERMLHYTLDVNNPESIQLVERMLEEFLPLFSSDYVNICCDETFDLGKGKNQQSDPKELYIKHLMSVIELVRVRGKRVMMWGDMLLEYRELLDRIPKDVVALNWCYSPKPTEETTAEFEKTGVTQYVCTGVHAWAGFAANTTFAENNIRQMALYGQKHHAIGLLNTNWGDHGHMNLLSASMHGVVTGAAYGWNALGTPLGNDFDEVFSITAYGDRSKTLGGLLRRLGDADPFRFWVTDDLSSSGLRALAADKYVVDVNRIRTNLEKASGVQRALEHLRVNCDPSVRQDYDEFIWTASMVNIVNRYALFVLAEEIDDRQELACEFERMYDKYAEIWRRRNKESELFRIREALLRVARRIREPLED